MTEYPFQIAYTVYVFKIGKKGRLYLEHCIWKDTFLLVRFVVYVGV